MVSVLNPKRILVQEHWCCCRNFSVCSDKVALIDCSCSVNQIWPGAWHCFWTFCSDVIVVSSKGNWSHPLSFVSLTLFITFTHLPSGPLGSGAERLWLLQASQTSEVLTRLRDETELLHTLSNGEWNLYLSSPYEDSAEQSTYMQWWHAARLIGGRHIL